MPVSPTYPGVYVQELPSGIRTIIGVATSIGAIVGGFARGPSDTALTVFNPGEFERDFGGLSAPSEASYQVKQFFLNGGSQLVVVRVAPGGAPADATLNHNDAGGAAEALLATAGRQVRGTSVGDPGSWGDNVRIDVDHEASDAANGFNLTVNEARAENGREIVVRSETFRNLLMDDGPSFAIDIVNAGSRMIQLSRDTGWTRARPVATGTVSDVVNVGGFAGMQLTNTLDVTIDGTTSQIVVPVLAAALTSLPEARGVLEGALRAGRPADPLFAGATVQVTGDGRLRVLAGRSGPNYAPDLIMTFDDNVGDLAATLSLRAGDNAVENVQQYALGSAAAPAGFLSAATPGTDAGALTSAALLGVRGNKTGLFALEDVNLFNILMIPEAATLGDVTDLAAVMSGAIAYCVERRAFALIDVAPNTASLDAAQTWLGEVASNGLRSRNAAAYFPRVQVPDPLNGNRLRTIGSSGTVAGIYARTDGARGVWKAPAGIEATLSGVSGLEYTLTDPEHGQLNPLGLNALRNFDVVGSVVWGARTLDGADILASDWKYTPVRRLALFVEESLFRGLQWVVFEPNDEPLWAQIRAAGNSFMQQLFRQGAFQGASPRQAYLVKCDAETTTQDDINAGIVNVFIGFAPLKPAEFVIISLQLLAGQAQA
jgi:phage tail sheath protein FI